MTENVQALLKNPTTSAELLKQIMDNRQKLNNGETVEITVSGKTYELRRTNSIIDIEQCELAE